MSLLIALAVVATPVAVEQPLSAGQAFHLADEAQAAGRVADTETILKALLNDANPSYRAEARFRLAQLRESQGDKNGALFWYQALLIEQPDAATVRIHMARLFASMGRRAAAERVLRQASRQSLPPDVAQTVDLFSSALRSQRPYGASLELALAPDTNINRAGSSSTISTVLGPLTPSEDARPTSGIGVTARAGSYARIKVGEVPLLARLSTEANLYRKDRFNDVVVSGQVGPELTVAGTRLRPAALLSRRWYGGKVYSRHAGVSVGAERGLGTKGQVRLDGTLARARYTNRLQDGPFADLRVTYDRRLGDSINARAYIRATRLGARDPGYAARSASLGGLLAWRLGRQTLLLEAEAGLLEADERLALFPERRSDKRLDLSAGVLLKRWEIGELLPVVRLRRSMTRSSLDLYDVRQTRLEFGLTREF